MKVKRVRTVLIRFIIAMSLVCLVFFVVFREQKFNWVLFSFVSFGLLAYCVFAYFVRPKPRRKSRDRSELLFFAMLLRPGRFVVVSIVDFIFLPFGRDIDHTAGRIRMRE
ncbi:MAG: hypothetical protein HKN47_14565 [Pirellulaceae bacterium]|nr:hypothetical protein [Pirellulaceae bacterium]